MMLGNIGRFWIAAPRPKASLLTSQLRFRSFRHSTQALVFFLVFAAHVLNTTALGTAAESLFVETFRSRLAVVSGNTLYWRCKAQSLQASLLEPHTGCDRKASMPPLITMHYCAGKMFSSAALLSPRRGWYSSSFITLFWCRRARTCYIPRVQHQPHRNLPVWLSGCYAADGQFPEDQWVDPPSY